MKLTFILILNLFCFIAVKSQSNFTSGTSEPKSFYIQKIIIPPQLVIKSGSENFKDTDNNGRLDAFETASVSFVIQNVGKGPAVGLKAITEINEDIDGLNFGRYQELGLIEPGKEREITIPISAGKNLETGDVKLSITITEPNGLDSDPLEVNFKTLKFQEPKIEIVDGIFSTEGSNNEFKKKVTTKLNFVVQNTGQSIAKKVTVNVSMPHPDVLALDQPLFEAGTLAPGESFSGSFSFIAKASFKEKQLTVKVTTKEEFDLYGSTKEFNVSLNQRLDESSKLVVQSANFQKTLIERQYMKSDVDRNVPRDNYINPNRYALVIGNEDYSSRRSSLSKEVNVEFARDDATSFKNYLTSTLGFEEERVTLLANATSGEINRAIEVLVKLAKLDSKSEIVVYYAGHGLPDDDKNPYLLPVDVSTINLIQDGISLKEMYSKLSSSNAIKITVFLDACFSGGGRDQGLLAARGVKIRPKEESVTGNMVVFASSSGEERSLTYKEKKHGFFTYFLLKKLQETKGDVNYGELSKYINKQVAQKSLLEMRLQQTPHVNVSPNVQNSWASWNFR